jgi:hypothetical protein
MNLRWVVLRTAVLLGSAFPAEIIRSAFAERLPVVKSNFLGALEGFTAEVANTSVLLC